MALDRYGLSRVVGDAKSLPQQAERLSAELPLRDGELLIDVDTLNIDAASFAQLKTEANGDAEKIGASILAIVKARGKMHNPVTGSGGMLLGSIAEVSPAHPGHSSLKVGQRIATLVSLTLTPLHLKTIKSVDLKTDRVEVSGHAILFPSGQFALLPDELPEKLALSALDVCGAPALVARYAQSGNTVGVLGAGKSGALCLAQARRSAGPQGRLIAMDISAGALAELKAAGLCDETLQVDATNPIVVLDAISAATSGQLCDLVVNCASVPNTEMATLFSVKERGTALFFSMATRFGSVALGAEGVAKDAQLIIGNGYAQGHAELTLGLLRSHPALKALFVRRYAQ